MSDKDFEVENADAQNPPESLSTNYTCGECGEPFESADALGRHTVHCDGGDEDEGE